MKKEKKLFKNRPTKKNLQVKAKRGRFFCNNERE